MAWLLTCLGKGSFNTAEKQAVDDRHDALASSGVVFIYTDFLAAFASGTLQTNLGEEKVEHVASVYCL